MTNNLFPKAVMALTLLLSIGKKGGSKDMSINLSSKISIDTVSAMAFRSTSRNVIPRKFTRSLSVILL